MTGDAGRSTGGPTSARIAHQAVRILGLHEPPVLLRSAANHLFRVGDVVLRVGEPGGDPAPQLELLAFLAGAGIPVLQPRTDPLRVEEHPVTVWDYLASDRPIDYHQLGGAIARLHRLDRSRLAQLVALRPYADAGWLRLEANLDGASATRVISPDDLAVLRRAADAVAGWEDVASASDLVVCHGDVHPLNVLMRGDDVIILDWDSICLGPPAWDHAALLTWARRWSGPATDYSAFAAGCGVDLTKDPVAGTLAQVRLLAATINLVIMGATSDRHAHEARRRMRHWRGDRDAPTWNPL